MNRSVRRLVGVSVLAPAAALAVAAAPALAAPGPSTTLLYDAYTGAAPVTQHLPPSVTGTAGQAAEHATLTADGLIGDAPGGTDVRTARCDLDPGKALHGGAGLADAPLSAVEKAPRDVLSQRECLRSASRASESAKASPGPVGGTPDLGDLSGITGDGLGGLLGGGLVNGPGSASRTRAAKANPPPFPEMGGASGLGVLPGGGSMGDVDTALGNGLAGLTGSAPQNGRLAESPVSMALTDLPGTLAKMSPAGLPVGGTLFPPAGRSARPKPADDLVGQANGLVDDAGATLDRPEGGVGKVVNVLKANERAATADRPVSLLDSSGLDLPGVPGLD